MEVYHLVMTNSLPWKDPPIFKNGKPSISMGHLYHGELLNNQRAHRIPKKISMQSHGQCEALESPWRNYTISITSPWKSPLSVPLLVQSSILHVYSHNNIYIYTYIHYITLLYITLQYTTLHYIALHIHHPPLIWVGLKIGYPSNKLS